MVHFSVDDTIEVFENLTNGGYSSCFEEPTLAFFRKLHEEYGLKVTMYCFFESDTGFCLSQATSEFKNEFKENSHWLRFAFHAYNGKSSYDDCEVEKFIDETEKIYYNLCRIVSSEALSYDVRLGFAKGNIDCIKAFKSKYPLFKNLYGADDNRIEYYLSQSENDILLDNGSYYDDKTGISIRLSELRLELQTNISEYIKQLPKRDYYVFFTHEPCFADEKVRNAMITLCEWTDKFIF